MELIYYVPEGRTLDEDILFKAQQSECSQVVIGKSDLIDLYLQDPSEPQIVYIPETNTVFLEKETFPLGEEIELYYLNEWLIYEKMEDLRIELHLVDMDDPKNIQIVEEYPLEKEGDIRFVVRFTPKTFGEYYIKLYDSNGFLYNKSLIVYKETVVENKDTEIEAPRFEV
jgi:hypothetical protein